MQFGIIYRQFQKAFALAGECSIVRHRLAFREAGVSVRKIMLILSMVAGLLQSGLAVGPSDLTQLLGFTPTRVIIVATNGTPSNTGLTESSPWDLQTALTQSGTAVPPGTAILLRGGTYCGPFLSSVSGSSNQPVVVRSYPGEWAVVNDGGSGTMSSSVNSTNESFKVSGSAQWVVGSLIQVEGEQMYIAGKNGTNLNNVARGWNGTTAAAHPAGAAVELLGYVIDCGGNFVWWSSFEITSVRSNRSVLATYKQGGLDLSPTSHGNKAINLVIHNVGHPAIGFWQQGDGGEVYGCILWGNGVYDGGTWTRGNGIYSQNTTGSVAIRDVISFRNFTAGMKAFGEGGYANGFTFEGNISFENPEGINIFAATSANPIPLVKIYTNFTYLRPGAFGENIGLGYVAPSNGLAEVIGNYVFGGNNVIAVKEFLNATIRNNTVLTDLPPNSDPRLVQFERTAGYPPHNYTIRSNVYYSLNRPYVFYYTGIPTGVEDFSKWKTYTAYDTNSSFSSSPPTSIIAVTRTNRYSPKRAHLVVYNYTSAHSLSYSLTNAGLVPGDPFVIRDAQNYLAAPVLTGTFSNQLVTIPLNLTNVSPIIGNVTHYQNVHTPELFNAFVIDVVTGTNAAATSGIRIKTFSRQGNTFSTSVTTTPGITYKLEYSSIPGGSSWTIADSVAGDGTDKFLTDSTATSPKRFYRVSAQ